MRTLLVADLHLSSDTPAINQGFYRYLEHTAPGADALYILGDLFDAWIGDDLLDANTHPLCGVAQEVIKRLRKLSSDGTAVYLMHGNRDFLLGERFINACQAFLLPDIEEVEIQGVPVVLLHGDSMCTRDEAYMAFRQQSRNPEWQSQMLALPLEQRVALAQSLRAQSGEANANKTEAIMDVTHQEVIHVMERHGVSTMIHGHTHRPHVHDLTVEDVPAKRYVLGDWDAQHGWDIIIERSDHTAPRLRQFSLTQLPDA
ncbi:UDP-2,3-diacylglucosamine diphosphatase [Halomonas sp. ISL-60]|uniref:UDP-2,3-diacylglucosamine diphosphatase n=1 Tax=unclassified Halomonas TaxID=2609666 RepID=UPI0007DA1E0A|nr:MULTISPECIES: UDP-2,3-diacylglucosamine diphosphatase [unclassified Halomonas]MBT2775119.1 UDP-2,3-diacylglucosamine diphosphatase [Halomonas sp. ISL-60]MBT2788877.1 UDP-2,3-diacylglucosamine diphosphatase [Halomonas sp. ISL-106]MBT2795556.1 UDP-2,3-diacylglucosamine diphosphatase [Halomonas sp. ISL-104]MBT2800082.1 UDP-2,3-diacylglucosamine diphosphatase [Halomonas sp. ISL-56]OAL60335.1 UDP-2,3-diacylglucosamine diphosphatase [Halomonas sp. ALS9]